MSIKDNLEFAAIVIPTLGRYSHFVRCIESLAKNKYASNSEIYIALDQAPDKKYETGRKKIEEYLDHGIVGFKQVHIYKHDINQGAADNMDFVLSWASKEHNRFIFTEDDNEFSPNYLEYINSLLDRYEKDENVLTVAGYNYPIGDTDFNGDLYYSKYYFAAFGFAGWFDKYYDMRNKMNLQWLYGIYKNDVLMRSLRYSAPNQYCNFIKGMVGYTALLEKDNEVWKMDLTYGLFMFSCDKKMIFPVLSKVRNWGYDGSGVNCDIMDYDPNKPVTHRNFGFECQALDTQLEHPGTREVSETDNKTIVEMVNRFFFVPKIEVFKCWLVYWVSRFAGVKNIRKIWNR